MLLVELAQVSREVAKTRARLKKVELIASLLRRVPAAEIEPVVALVSGAPRQGRIGVGGALLRFLLDVPMATTATVGVAELDATLESFKTIAGNGSAAARKALLVSLFGRLTSEERDFVVGALGAGLRQGALEGVVLDAVASAAAVPAEKLRRALLMAGNFEDVARAALSGGEAELARFSIELFRPLRPMLADTALDLADALGRFRGTALEYKLDGARIQVHRSGDRVAVYSRQLQDVTARVPELVAAALSLPVTDVILDGEAVAFDADGRPLPFQTTMQRFGRQRELAELEEAPSISQRFFDCLYLNGVSLLDAPNSERFATLSAHVPPRWLVTRLLPDSLDAADAFQSLALATGHEGLVVKDLEAPYDAGRRGSTWLKLKPVHTLDLVVLAAEWGSGRRHGTLSNIHLGARDSENGGFVMLGKTFKGMTDAMLAWQTQRFLELERERTGHVVWLRPELVVEVAFDGVQESQQYPGGLSLRFARVRRYRDDKQAAEADTLATVRGFFERSRGLNR